MKMGLIHLYTGDGKGKTTAALGLSVRAAGNGMRVLFVQFQKGRETGELAGLEKCGISVLRNSRDFGFVRNMSQSDRIEITAENNENMEKAIGMAYNDRVDMIVFDEVMSVYNNGLIDCERVKWFVLNRPEKIELVLTGRNADTFFVESCDYLTVMECKKHPFDRGIAARKGIEY